MLWNYYALKTVNQEKQFNTVDHAHFKPNSLET